MENLIVTGLIGFVVVTLLLLVFVVLKMRKSGFGETDLKYILNQWRRIETDFKKDPRHAIMDADKLLDFVLKKKGYSGHLGQKLKDAKGLFSDLNGVWSAHKVRNKLAHELDYRLGGAEGKMAMSQFKRALKDLGVKF